jgi:hypothetical protein
VTEAFCCWCGQTQPARVARVANGRAELQCDECRQRWLAEPVLGQPAFVFASADVGAKPEPIFFLERLTQCPNNRINQLKQGGRDSR